MPAAYQANIQSIDEPSDMITYSPERQSKIIHSSIKYNIKE